MVLLDFVFYGFLAAVIVQVFFYFFLFGIFVFSKPQKKTTKNVPVSVIVCAKNEAENLKTFLPSLLNQNHPNFEIVLINDASNDNTLEVMEQFSQVNNNIKIVNVKNNEAFWGNKKFALTLGIKASKNNVLLFTDADCKPLSKNWIQEMSNCFDGSKSIVLGYGSYSKNKKSFLNKLIRFETFITAINYFSFAKIGLPYMGVGRNLAYRKEEFFNANGFVNHMKIHSGDDDLFVNQVASSKNTALCYSTDSFTISLPKTSFKDWFKQKRRHISTAKYYKASHKILLTLLYVSNLWFWLFFIILVTSLFNWKIVLGIFIFRLFIQYLILGVGAKKLGETDLLILLPFLEIFLIITQFSIFINNIISKPKYWK